MRHILHQIAVELGVIKPRIKEKTSLEIALEESNRGDVVRMTAEEMYDQDMKLVNELHD